MSKAPPFVWFEIGWRYGYNDAPQHIKNGYFYQMGECINDHFVRYNKTYEWKSKMFEELISNVGMPKRLTLLQKINKLFSI
jgi:hypothetical protein